MQIEQWIVVLSLLGFADSVYTALQQRIPKLFSFCFTKEGKRTDCYEILHGKYAGIFRIPNSWLGIVSYLFLALLYWTAPKFTVVGAQGLYWIGAFVASAGFVFSAYLLHVQANILRKYCIFCLISTTLISIIMVLAWIALF